ncbi:hypothetical protein EDC14_100329 [Hydrogenispora ethanolica]|uniref:Cytochrome c-type biogenesis protein CcmF C-terminal domain-containing protein n=1 Tax=Hydrogenispora ethanolica TaxID=1082276 RepID=A0A4R1S787_HYDET|nr:hypothetical protein [Hydrogenispora ethanolica]TCL75099.1 hypothetical protein EDC14_100329 [Hydrogenispora ethanolica]
MTLLAWLCLCIALGAAIVGLAVIGRERRSGVAAQAGFRLSLAAGAGLIFAGTVMPQLIFAANMDQILGWLSLLLVLGLGLEPALGGGRSVPLRRRLWAIGPGLAIGLVIGLFPEAADRPLLFRLLIAGTAMALVNTLIFWMGLGEALGAARNRSGILIRSAALITVIGFGSALLTTAGAEEVLEPGDAMTAGEYRIVYRGLRIEPQPGGTRKYTAWLEVKRGAREHFLANAEMVQDPATGRTRSRTRIHADRAEELRLLVAGYEENGRIRLKARFLRHMYLVWLGGLLLLAGAILEMLQQLDKRPARLVLKPLKR